ncbi:aspartic proteinase CDR1-like [Heracleum sosnowskyi]|uniref:Aspartic proteinase CDR1-like n=1 Tax=Heracleum sosnowskyi TaxID=360622 RepID=A0AAD8HWB4_9APIA|nr:aspartic proteinase CDR1-like [Heracleum sosnowskyi]
MVPGLFLCFISTLSFLTSPIQSHSSGFSINLIHRDSPLSAYYDNLRNSLRRSMIRSSHIFTPKLASRLPTIRSPLTPQGGEYLMKISVGTPPREFLAVVDTGSDLTWIQCKPCINCSKQMSPLFDPNKSSTYRKQPCQSKACQSLQPPLCDNNNFCKYEVFNGDDLSHSTGDLSLESFAFESTSGKPVIVPKFSFGCGRLNRGRFDDLTNGIVGLGNGDLSIFNQLGDTIQGKFSYCMVPLKLRNVSSKISFGNDALVSGSGVQTTQLFTKDQDTFYYLNLESVSIGDRNLKFETNNANDNNGNMIIDSASIATYLPSEFYQKIEDELRRIIPLTPVEREEVLRLCYKIEEGVEQKVPNITFHFTGADWKLGALNTVLGMHDGKSCLSIAPGASKAIFGNLQQMNYLVGFDLNDKTLSFKKTDCTKY